MGAAPDPPPDKPQDASPPEGRQGPQPTSGGGGGGHRRPTLPSLPGFLAGARPSGPPAPVEPPEPPDEFIDPISQELLIDPVLLVETGQSYERSNLEIWFKRCQEAGRPCTDPLTRQVLRHTTVVPNFSLKSLVSSWAERHRISDLSTFSKGMGRQRTMARVHSPGSPAALAAEALAELNLGPGAVPHATGQSDGSAGKPSYPALAGSRLGTGDSAGPEPTPTPPPLQRRQASVPPRPSSPQEYPSMRPGTAPPGSRRQAAETALGALRSAAAPGGGSASASRGAAPYHAWSLMQLAGDAEGRRILWEENAIPLSIYMLGQSYTQQPQGQQPAEEDPLDAAKPALCALLQRLAARDREVAASIAQCGGIQALVGQLTAADPARRAAGCFALYFLGWQGAAIRSAIYEALAEHAAACRLPPRALMAFWRFWEQQQQQQQHPAAAGQAGSRPGSPNGSSQAGGGNHADLAEGREAQWEPLALLLHMLSEGTASSGGGTPTAASQHMLQQLDAAGTAIPAVLAHGAVASSDPAVNFAAARAASLLAQLPQNLPLLIPAVLQAGQAAAAGAAGAALGETAPVGHPGYAVIGGSETAGGKAAGNMAALLWELSCSPASGGTYPPAVQLVQQGGAWLLPALEAALDPAQGRQAACRRMAAGFLACLLFEPPHQQPGTPAAAAADGMRRLLAQTAAAQVLQRLLALLQPDVAAAHPQAARAAALAVANMAAFRGAAPAAAAQVPEATPAGMRAKLAGLTNRLKRATPGSLGSGDYSQALGSGGSTTEGASSSFDREQPTEPRAALQYFGAVHLLLRLVPHCGAAAAAAEATAATAARAPAAPMLAQPNTLASPTAAQQAAAAASAAAESAAEQRAVLVAVLQALNNLCADPALAARLQRWARPTVEAHQQLTAALMAAMADPNLPPASREHARLLLHTESGAPGQRHALACTLLAPPARAAAYPNP